MNALSGKEVRKKKTRVGLCVGLGIGLGAFGMVVLGASMSCSSDGPSRENAAHAKLREFTAKLETHRMISGDYPSQEQGLMALVELPEVEPLPRRWKQQFKELPKDPWGQEYRYIYPGRVDPERFEVVSGGEDMEFGTVDDVSSAGLD